MSYILWIRIVWRMGFRMGDSQRGVLDGKAEGFYNEFSALWVNVWNQHPTRGKQPPHRRGEL